MSPEIWWYVARATGVVAWALSVGAVLWGLALASRATARKPGPAWLLDLHRHLGGLTLLFTVAHVLAVVADSYVHFGLADVLVPLASDWKPVAIAAGVVGMWLFAAVEVTSLMKPRLPLKTWRLIHLTSYLAAVASTGHMLAAGADTGHPLLRWAPTVAVSLATVLLTYRALMPRRRGRREPAAA